MVGILARTEHRPCRRTDARRHRPDDHPRAPLLPPVAGEPRRGLEQPRRPPLPRLGVVLPRALAARPHRALHPRRQLHRLLLVAGPREAGHRHLGDPADGLPGERRGRPRLRAARLPAGGLVLLVRLLAAAHPLPVRARRAAGALPGGARRHRRPGGRLGVDRRRPGRAGGLHLPARQGRLRAGHLGRGLRHGGRGARAHHPPLGPRPRGRLLADPGDVDGLLRRRARASSR